jgi:hypothetical protein
MLTAAGGASILDVTVPGGSGWLAHPTSWAYKNKLGLSGITKIAIKKSTKVPGLLKMTIKGAHGTIAVTPADLPLTATVIIEVPMATAGQCAAQTFTGPLPTPLCAFNKKSTAVRCK